MKKLTAREFEDEEWVENITTSTKEAEDQMNRTRIPCLIEALRRMKWRMALRTATLPEERWLKNTIEWNPGLKATLR